jgi:hypothetical protein
MTLEDLVPLPYPSQGFFSADLGIKADSCVQGRRGQGDALAPQSLVSKYHMGTGARREYRVPGTLYWAQEHRANAASW